MPSLSKDFLEKLQDDYKKYTTFIESGTFLGGTIFSLEPHFEKLHTIEFSEKYYQNTKNQYHGNKINFILGDSSIIFQSLLPTIDERAIFFLDGHWSSGDTGKSEKDCPLIEEVTHIHNLFKNEAIIIIDDYRLFGLSKETGLNEDWSQISKGAIINILSSRIYKLYHLDSECAKDDRFIIHLSKK